MIGVHILAVGVIGMMQATSLIGPMIGGKGEKALEVEENQKAPWGRALGVLGDSRKGGLGFRCKRFVMAIR